MVCATCGSVPLEGGDARSRWAMGVENGRIVWTCQDCQRRFLRGIESKLDSEWW